MANVTAVLEAQKSLEAALFQKMTDFENQLKAASVAPTKSITTSQLQADFEAFQKLVSSILNLLREQILECCKSVDTIEMRHRRKYLLISGISEDIQDNLSSHILKLLEEKLGLQDIAADKIKVCHRLGSQLDGKCRPVLIRFTDLSLKSLVWRKKTGFKGSHYVISEFLTHQRQSLFIQARKRLGIRNCWTLDGNIFAKLRDGSKHRITSEEDLLGLPDPTNQLDENVIGGNLQCGEQVAPSTSTNRNARAKRAARQKK